MERVRFLYGPDDRVPVRVCLYAPKRWNTWNTQVKLVHSNELRCSMAVERLTGDWNGWNTGPKWAKSSVGGKIAAFELRNCGRFVFLPPQARASRRSRCRYALASGGMRGTITGK